MSKRISRRIKPIAKRHPYANLVVDNAAEEKLLGRPGTPALDHLGRVTPEAREQQQLLLAAPGPSHDNDHGSAVMEEGAMAAKTTKAERKLTVHKDHNIEFPDLWIRVYVHGPRWDCNGFAELFARAACTKAPSPEKADVVVFTGGEDVSPTLYGELFHYRTSSNIHRDISDIKMYLRCYALGIPMVGVCRGAQFLNVMNRGKLFQHVDNHNGTHGMWDITKKTLIERVSSVHHQACIRNGGMTLIGTIPKSKIRWRTPNKFDEGTHADVEAFFYPDTACFGVQGHPEYRGFNYFSKWFLEEINELLLVNLDLDWVDSKDPEDKLPNGSPRQYRRLTPLVMSNRPKDSSPPDTVYDFLKKHDKTVITNIIKES